MQTILKYIHTHHYSLIFISHNLYNHNYYYNAIGSLLMEKELNAFFEGHSDVQVT